MTGQELRLVAGDATLVVDAVAGGRMASLETGGLELLVGRTGDPLGWGCYPMAPWAGRVGHACFEWAGDRYDLEPTMPPHAIHGTVHRRSWDVLDEHTIRTDLGPGWPFAGEVTQRFELTDRTVRAALELRAIDRPFPATLGWHPWFRRSVGGARAELRLEATAMYERGSDHLPTGRLIDPAPGPWDDTFTGLLAPVVITWGDRLRLTVESDLDHVVVYDEPPEALCVEPQSGPPDAFASGRATTVMPGRPLTATMEWSWEVRPGTR